MVDFWQKFLGAAIAHKNEKLAFLRFDEEHHRIATIGLPSLGPKNPKSAGLDHISFTYDMLNDLAESYQQRKTLGLKPVWCVNHGPTCSIYWEGITPQMFGQRV